MNKGSQALAHIYRLVQEDLVVPLGNRANKPCHGNKLEKKEESCIG